jgi:superfamily II DNA or RNA helicase
MKKNTYKTFLNNNGYNITTKYLKKYEIKKIESELTVLPKMIDATEKEIKKAQYKVYSYSDDSTSIIVPRYYGISRFGKPEYTDFDEAEEIDIEFTKELRPKQQEVTDLCIKYITKNGGGLLSVPCGFGKCLAKGTSILLYSGMTKPVEEITNKDILMGDDSTPRKVISIASGSEDMFKINDVDYNESYTVNSSHILSLKYIKFESLYIEEFNRMFYYGDILNIEVKDFIKYGNKYNMSNNFKGYRTAINFNRSYSGVKKIVLNNLSVLRREWIITDKKTRLLILKKLLENLTYTNEEYINLLFKNKSSCIVTLNSDYYSDLQFLVRSLGYGIKKILNCDSNSDLNMIKVEIMLRDCTTYNITIEYVGIGNYYGFEIDANRLFVLGDLTVTHNTVCALYIAQKLGLKTLVVVHKSFLLNQWIDRAMQFLNIKRENIGIIKQKQCDIEGKDLVIGMIHTISKRDYNEYYKQFGLVIYDEAHHVPAKSFSKTLMKTSSAYTLALTATPYRQDGLIKVMYWFTGGTIYREKMKMNNNVVVKVLTHKSTDRSKFRKETAWFRGKMVQSSQKMNKNLIEIETRNNKIINMVTYLRRTFPERKILVLSEFVVHLQFLKTEIDKYIQDDIDDGLIDEDEIYSCYYIGTTKPAKRQEAEDRGDIIFSTYQMASEGLDIKRLNTLIYGLPKKDIVQIVGRIMRTILQSGDIRPLIIDIQDDLQLYNKWSKLRNEYYIKCKYQIEEYYMKDENFMTSNTYYAVDDIQDMDRPMHHENMELHKMINESNIKYNDWKKQVLEFETLCAGYEKRIIMSDDNLNKEYELTDFANRHNVEILEKFEPYKMGDILYTDVLTENDFEIVVLKDSAVEGDKLDIDRDIELDPDDLENSMKDELMKHCGTKYVKEKTFAQKIKSVRLV